ncbi:MAG: hypothetical protein GF404_05460 [candidate division Zixibacteria bacterium]|nr:hypothetical protein [candidate division Zixibacteria bacterium]
MPKSLTLILITIITLGCADPFSSRDPQTPATEQGTFIQPSEPQLVLLNLEFAYEEQVITNFIRCLDSSFFFKYDFINEQFGVEDSGWTFASELKLTENLFNNLLADTTLSISITLTDLEQTTDQFFDTSAVLYRSYLISSVRHQDGMVSTDSTTFKGTSIFTLIENEQGLWSISKWEDQHQRTDRPSWADFKNNYR